MYVTFDYRQSILTRPFKIDAGAVTGNNNINKKYFTNDGLIANLYLIDWFDLWFTLRVVGECRSSLAFKGMHAYK